jgi:hypothetical protein
MLSPAPAPAPTSNESIEILIGEVTAAAAVELLRALFEWERHGLTQRTRSAGGNLIAQLHELRQGTMGELDFEQVVRVYGLQALRERCVGEWNPVAGRILVDNVLDILDGVAKARLN